MHTMNLEIFAIRLCSPEIFNKELLKNGEVRKNLKNNFLDLS